MPESFQNVWMLLLVICVFGGCHDLATQETIATPANELPAPGPIAADRTQLVTVISNDWNEFRATLRRFERDPGEPWKPVGPAIDVVLGREGYGWGRGLHGEGAPPGRPGPIKQEGDGRSPAGAFEIGAAYGYDAAHDDIALPYAQASPKLRCVDDPSSSHYNRIVSTADTEVDWTSAEHMRRKDDLYVLAIVVEHNVADTKPGAGSCIFIHLWEGPDRGMSGCTAMPLDALTALATWLEPDAAVLVALPRNQYDALGPTWGLPRDTTPASSHAR